MSTSSSPEDGPTGGGVERTERDPRPDDRDADSLPGPAGPLPAGGAADVPDPASRGPSAPGAGDAEERPARSLEERLAGRTPLSVPARHNPVLSDIVDAVNEDDEIYALWVAQNVNAVDRLGISDHGPVHVQIVANSALKILRLLVDAGVRPSVVEDYGFSEDDAEVVVVLAALLHDVGISIHRDGHEAYSLFVARPLLDRLLEPHYDAARATVLRSEVLHAVISHRAGGDPLTLEAGIMKVADALDMAEGRSRIPFEAGSMSIHSVSAAAIEEIRLEEGDETPVRVRIDMTNSAGVFQVDELLRNKLRGSGLEDYLQVEAHIERDTEKRLVERFRL
ncbi:MAG: HD domain-containing protein [Gemmatimonadota bacterium]